jgi:hypothetical protein
LQFDGPEGERPWETATDAVAEWKLRKLNWHMKELLEEGRELFGGKEKERLVRACDGPVTALYGPLTAL